MTKQLGVIGVDVGGTNTDAVLMKGSVVVSATKTLTTYDVSEGVETAIREVIKNCKDQYKIQRINIGTTHFINAVLQRRHLAKVAVLRFCSDASRAVPPFCGFPNSLRKVMEGKVYMLQGGFRLDGLDITKFDEDEVKKCVHEIKESGIKNIVVCGVFSTVYHEQETKAKEIIESIIPDASITLSSTIGYLGMLERENATILNESLRPLAAKYVRGFGGILERLHLQNCKFYFTANDGTIISLQKLIESPVLTFSSGATNSMRGAACLSGERNAIVVDIGGTSTDVGVLKDGFPRPAGEHIDISGVRTNFQMPDVYSIALGGGSLVEVSKDDVKIGPISVGYKLLEKCCCCGGNSLTVTDLAAAGDVFTGLGDPNKAKAVISPEDTARAIDQMRKMVEAAIDSVKISVGDVPVILVGGGSLLLDTNKPLTGCSKIYRPENCQVANAVGAALSQVSGVSQNVVPFDNEDREEQIASIRQQAIDSCVNAGGILSSVEVIEFLKTPLQYLPGNLVTVKIRVVADLDEGFAGMSLLDNDSFKASIDAIDESKLSTGETEVDDDEIEPHENVNYDENGDWILSKYDINCIALGAGIFGAGGGASPELGRLKLLGVGKPIRIRSVERYIESNPNGKILTVAYMGAPAVIFEQLVAWEPSEAARVMLAYLKKTSPKDIEINEQIVETEDFRGIPTFVGELPDPEKEDLSDFALFCAEIGGCNSLEPLSAAAKLGLVVIDADGMGRAFPELQMFLPFVHGLEPFTATLASVDHRRSLILTAATAKKLEDTCRNIIMEMGCAGGLCLTPITGEIIKKHCCQKSYTKARRLGHQILTARKNLTDIVEAILSVEKGFVICKGKIIDVLRKTEGAFNRGEVIIQDFNSSDTLLIEFQNENIIATTIKEDGTKHVTATVPNMICIIDSVNGDPVLTENLRYGLRVTVIVLDIDSLWKTEKGLAVTGPKAFGYDVEFQPIS